MSRRVAAGRLVDIGIVVLQAGERAPQVPEDTAAVDLEMKVRGRLTAEAEIGAPAEIETPTGRRIGGTLLTADPEYTHRFGAPIPELTPIGGELRRLLREGRGSGEAKHG